MRSGGNNFNYSTQNKMTKLANLVQYSNVCLCFVWRIGVGAGPLPLVYTPLPPRLYTCRPLDPAGSTALALAITARPIHTTLLWACRLFHIYETGPDITQA